MGCVSRPVFSRVKSSHPCISVTVWRANNSGVARFEVVSYVNALTPFSQNSVTEASSGSGQAQPGQSKPRGWFIRKSVLFPLRKLSRLRKWKEEIRAPHPPALVLGLAMTVLFAPFHTA